MSVFNMQAQVAGFQGSQPGRGRSLKQPGYPQSSGALWSTVQQLPSAPDVPGCQKMLWFMGMGSGTYDDYEAFIQAALLSANAHAPSLVPVLLYCGKPGNFTRQGHGSSLGRILPPPPMLAMMHPLCMRCRGPCSIPLHTAMCK